LIKQWWKEIGVDTELRHIEAAVFFGADPASNDTVQEFYADIEMYAYGFTGTDPERYMGNWSCGKIPNPASQWLGSNMARYCNPEYDRLVTQMASTSELEKRGEIAKKLNDLLIQEGAIIPLVHRGKLSAHANSLAGVKHNAWDSELWNVADWHRAP